jgi:hypothetical protein
LARGMVSPCFRSFSRDLVRHFVDGDDGAEMATNFSLSFSISTVSAATTSMMAHWPRFPSVSLVIEVRVCNVYRHGGDGFPL